MARVVVAAVCITTVVVAVLSLRAAGADTAETALARQIETVATAPAGFPLFVHQGGEVWYQPLAVYPSSLLLMIGAPREIALMVPPLMSALATAVLTYALAIRVPLPPPLAAFATALLLVTPGYVRYAGAPGADLLMVVTLLAWCVVVLEHVARPRRWLPAVGGAVLAASAYTQPAGVLAVPLFLVVGAAAFRRAGSSWRPVLVAGAAAGLVLLPIGIWLLRHPEHYPDTFGRWAIHAAHVRNPIEGIVSFTRWHVAARRVSAYWEYLSPTFVFASGQVLGLWAAALVPVGVWAASVTPLTVGRWLTLCALFTAPVPAVLLDVGRSGAFVVMLVPFAAVAAALAVPRLWRMRASARFAAFSGAVLLVAAELTRLAK